MTRKKTKRQNFEKLLGKRTVSELRSYDAVVISGASSGIGEGFVRVLDAVCFPKLCNLSRSFPSLLYDRQNFLNVPCDLRKTSEISSAFEKICSWLELPDLTEGCESASAPGKLAVKVPKILLINNAGFGAYGDFPSPSIGRNCDMIDVNARALTELCGLFMPYIALGGGAIINISSTAAFQACPQLSAYAATKAYVKSFSLSLWYELRKSGAKCLCVCPGPTSSNFFSAAGFNSPPLPSWFGHCPDDVAISAYRALSKGMPIKVVGLLNSLQAFFVRFVPLRVLTAISGAVLSRIRKIKK